MTQYKAGDRVILANPYTEYQYHGISPDHWYKEYTVAFQGRRPDMMIEGHGCWFYVHPCMLKPVLVPW